MKSDIAPILAIGIGQRLRQDDGVGPAVAAKLRGAGLTAVEHSGEGMGLIELWGGRQLVFVIDATRFGDGGGTVRRFDAAETVFGPDIFRCSSHSFGLAQAIETARALGRLPARLIVYGIEGDRFGFGESLSQRVAAAADDVAARIAEEFKAAAAALARSDDARL